MQEPQGFSLAGQASHTQSNVGEEFRTRSNIWGKSAFRHHNMTEHPLTKIDGLRHQNMIQGTGNLHVQPAIGHSSLLHEMNRHNMMHPNSYNGYFEGRR